MLLLALLFGPISRSDAGNWQAGRVLFRIVIVASLVGEMFSLVALTLDGDDAPGLRCIVGGCLVVLLSGLLGTSLHLALDDRSES